MIWFFERQQSRLHYEVRHQTDGHAYELVITHPDGRQDIELFSIARAHRAVGGPSGVAAGRRLAPAAAAAQIRPESSQLRSFVPSPVVPGPESPSWSSAASREAIADSPLGGFRTTADHRRTLSILGPADGRPDPFANESCRRRIRASLGASLAQRHRHSLAAVHLVGRCAPRSGRSVRSSPLYVRTVNVALALSGTLDHEIAVVRGQRVAPAVGQRAFVGDVSVRWWRPPRWTTGCRSARSAR